MPRRRPFSLQIVHLLASGLLLLVLVDLLSPAAQASDVDDQFGWQTLKERWKQAGVDVNAADAEELWAIPTGGARPSEHYIGATAVSVAFDPARIADATAREGAWGTFEISGIDIRGKPFSNYPLYAFNQTSTSEADPNLRLYELAYNWHDAKDRLSVRIGKLDLSSEFIVSTTAQTFLNGSFGWPMLPSNNLYAQGPASPVATPAMRVRYAFAPKWHVQLAVADDNPTGARHFNNPDDPWNQNQDPSGTRFSFRTGTFVIGEVSRQVRIARRKGLYKIGFFADTGKFPLQADPDVSRRGNWAVYTVLDQILLPDTAMGTLRGFVRWEYTGLADRNQISSSLDAGLVLEGPFQRKSDALGLGFGYAAPSHFLMLQRPDGTSRPHGDEYHLELTYSYQALSWMTVQPDLQGLINPSGGAYDSGRRVRNALIFGLHVGTVF